MLTAAMETTQITLVESCTSSKKILDKLDLVYQQKSEFNKMIILDRFHQMKMNSDDTVAQYVARVENLARQVRVTQPSLQKFSVRCP